MGEGETTYREAYPDPRIYGNQVYAHPIKSRLSLISLSSLSKSGVFRENSLIKRMSKRLTMSFRSERKPTVENYSTTSLSKRDAATQAPVLSLKSTFVNSLNPSLYGSERPSHVRLSTASTQTKGESSKQRSVSIQSGPAVQEIIYKTSPTEPNWCVRCCHRKEKKSQEVHPADDWCAKCCQHNQDDDFLERKSLRKTSDHFTPELPEESDHTDKRPKRSSVQVQSDQVSHEVPYKTSTKESNWCVRCCQRKPKKSQENDLSKDWCEQHEIKPHDNDSPERRFSRQNNDGYIPKHLEEASGRKKDSAFQDKSQSPKHGSIPLQSDQVPQDVPYKTSSKEPNWCLRCCQRKRKKSQENNLPDDWCAKCCQPQETKPQEDDLTERRSSRKTSDHFIPQLPEESNYRGSRQDPVSNPDKLKSPKQSDQVPQEVPYKTSSNEPNWCLRCCQRKRKTSKETKFPDDWCAKCCQPRETKPQKDDLPERRLSQKTSDHFIPKLPEESNETDRRYDTISTQSKKSVKNSSVPVQSEKVSQKVPYKTSPKEPNWCLQYCKRKRKKPQETELPDDWCAQCCQPRETGPQEDDFPERPYSRNESQHFDDRILEIDTGAREDPLRKSISIQTSIVPKGEPISVQFPHSSFEKPLDQSSATNLSQGSTATFWREDDQNFHRHQFFSTAIEPGINARDFPELSFSSKQPTRRLGKHDFEDDHRIDEDEEYLPRSSERPFKDMEDKHSPEAPGLWPQPQEFTAEYPHSRKKPSIEASQIAITVPFIDDYKPDDVTEDGHKLSPDEWDQDSHEERRSHQYEDRNRSSTKSSRKSSEKPKLPLEENLQYGKPPSRDLNRDNMQFPTEEVSRKSKPSKELYVESIEDNTPFPIEESSSKQWSRKDEDSLHPDEVTTTSKRGSKEYGRPPSVKEEKYDTAPSEVKPPSRQEIKRFSRQWSKDETRQPPIEQDRISSRHQSRQPSVDHYKENTQKDVRPTSKIWSKEFHRPETFDEAKATSRQLREEYDKPPPIEETRTSWSRQHSVKSIDHDSLSSKKSGKSPSRQWRKEEDSHPSIKENRITSKHGSRQPSINQFPKDYNAPPPVDEVRTSSKQSSKQPSRNRFEDVKSTSRQSKKEDDRRLIEDDRRTSRYQPPKEEFRTTSRQSSRKPSVIHIEENKIYPKEYATTYPIEEDKVASKRWTKEEERPYLVEETRTGSKQSSRRSVSPFEDVKSTSRQWQKADDNALVEGDRRTSRYQSLDEGVRTVSRQSSREPSVSHIEEDKIYPKEYATKYPIEDVKTSSKQWREEVERPYPIEETRTGSRHSSTHSIGPFEGVKSTSRQWEKADDKPLIEGDRRTSRYQSPDEEVRTPSRQSNRHPPVSHIEDEGVRTASRQSSRHHPVSHIEDKEVRTASRQSSRHPPVSHVEEDKIHPTEYATEEAPDISDRRTSRYQSPDEGVRKVSRQLSRHPSLSHIEEDKIHPKEYTTKYPIEDVKTSSKQWREEEQRPYPVVESRLGSRQSSRHSISPFKDVQLDEKPLLEGERKTSRYPPPDEQVRTASRQSSRQFKEDKIPVKKYDRISPIEEVRTTSEQWKNQEDRTHPIEEIGTGSIHSSRQPSLSRFKEDSGVHKYKPPSRQWSEGYDRSTPFDDRPPPIVEVRSSSKQENQQLYEGEREYPDEHTKTTSREWSKQPMADSIQDQRSRQGSRQTQMDEKTPSVMLQHAPSTPVSRKWSKEDYHKEKELFSESLRSDPRPSHPTEYYIMDGEHSPERIIEPEGSRPDDQTFIRVIGDKEYPQEDKSEERRPSSAPAGGSFRKSTAHEQLIDSIVDRILDDFVPYETSDVIHSTAAESSQKGPKTKRKSTKKMSESKRTQKKVSQTKTVGRIADPRKQTSRKRSSETVWEGRPIYSTPSWKAKTPTTSTESVASMKDASTWADVAPRYPYCARFLPVNYKQSYCWTIDGTVDARRTCSTESANSPWVHTIAEDGKSTVYRLSFVPFPPEAYRNCCKCKVHKNLESNDLQLHQHNNCFFVFS